MDKVICRYQLCQSRTFSDPDRFRLWPLRYTLHGIGSRCDLCQGQQARLRWCIGSDCETFQTHPSIRSVLSIPSFPRLWLFDSIITGRFHFYETEVVVPNFITVHGTL